MRELILICTGWHTKCALLRTTTTDTSHTSSPGPRRCRDLAHNPLADGAEDESQLCEGVASLVALKKCAPHERGRPSAP